MATKNARIHVPIHSPLYWWLEKNGHHDKTAGFDIPEEHMKAAEEELDTHPAHQHYTSDERSIVVVAAALNRCHTPAEIVPALVESSKVLDWIKARIYRAAASRIWLQLWRAMVLAALVLIAFELKAEQPRNPSAPKSISVEDQNAVKDLRITAYEALTRLKDAETRRAQADLDADRAQRDLDLANARITTRTAELRTKYGAPEALFEINPRLEWIPKKPVTPQGASQ